MAARETAKILGRIALTTLCCAAGATFAAEIADYLRSNSRQAFD